MTTISIDTDEVFERAKAALADTYTLVYAAYDDTVTDDQLAYIFEHGADDDSWFQWFDEARRQGFMSVVHDLIPDRMERDALSTTDEWDELVELIFDRDDSAVFDQMLANTHSKLLRYRLGPGDDDLDLDPDSWNWTDEQVNAAARRLGELIPGVDFAYLPQLRELVVEASNGGTLWVLWYADVDDLVQASFDDDVERTITWTSPHILVLDRFNGSGHDVHFDGLTLTAKWDRTRLVLDANDFGYSWDKVCGLHKPAYACHHALEPRPGEGR